MDRNYFIELFKSKGLTENEIATKLNIQTDSLYRKLKGQRKISLNEIIVILDCLDMKFEDVFKRGA